MASSVFLYGAHLKQGKGWVKSLSDEEREVTALRSTKSRIRGEARCAAGAVFRGHNYLLQLIITAIVSPRVRGPEFLELRRGTRCVPTIDNT